MMQRVDPITMACVAGGLQSIAKEMSLVMLKTARSGSFKVARDFSAHMFDARGRFMVLDDKKALTHIASLSLAVKHFIEYYGDDINPGDVVYYNDSVIGGNHLPDCAVVRPIFLNGDLVAWSSCKAHMIDIGGVGVGGIGNARELYAEGLRITPVKIYERGRERKDVVDLIMANVRFPEPQRGDLQAKMAASAIGEKRFLELIARYSRDTVLGCIEDLLSVREHQMRAWIDSLAEGVYESKALVEYPAAHAVLEIGVSITVKGDEMSIVFNSPPQVEGGINSYPPNTRAGVLIGLNKFAKLSPPINEGVLGPIKIDYGPDGTLLNARLPAPCGMCTTTPLTSVVDMMTEALSKAAPPEAMAAGWYHVTTTKSTGTDPRNGKRYHVSHFPAFAGGAGAVWGSDGFPGLGSEIALGGQNRGDIEYYEIEYPIRIWRQEFITDSGGAGRWRGGQSLDYEVEPLGGPVEIAIAGDDKGLPLNLAGAKPTLLGPKMAKRLIRDRATGGERYLACPETVQLNVGETLHTWVAGGGGVGSPFERPPEVVLREVIDEVVSLEGAREDYGVVIDPKTMTVDLEATRALRKQRMTEA